eukprot:233195_1
MTSSSRGQYASRTVILLVIIVAFLFYSLVTSIDSWIVGGSQSNQNIVTKRLIRGDGEGQLNEHISSRRLQEKECFIEHSAKLDLTLCTTAKGLARDDVDWSGITESQLKVALVNNSVIGYPTADSIEVEILGTEGPVPCKLGGAVQWHIQVSYKHKIDENGKIVYAPEVASACLDNIMGYRADNVFIQGVLAEIGMVKHISHRGLVGVAEPFNSHNKDEVSIEASGWSIIFHESTPEVAEPVTEQIGAVNGLSISLGGKKAWWPPWTWVIFVLAALLCFIPTYVVVIRRRAKNGTKSLEANKKSVRFADSGLYKIRGPEWGITELDFTSSGNVYGDPNENWNELNESLTRAAAAQLSPDVARETSTDRFNPHTNPVDVAWGAEGGELSEWNETRQSVHHRVGSSLGVPKFDMNASQDEMHYRNNWG